MRITPLSQVMGAEVSGVDLNAPLGAAERDQLYQAFLDFLLLCVSGQTFADIAAFLNAARPFLIP
jgi:alpha-ketoglutarate-dependent taurine dioxygenase